MRTIGRPDGPRQNRAMKKCMALFIFGCLRRLLPGPKPSGRVEN